MSENQGPDFRKMAADDDDVEGHVRKSMGSDAPSDGEDDVEGHMLKHPQALDDDDHPRRV